MTRRASRASVLARWPQRGHDAARADTLLSAYDEFYAEPDADAAPPALRRRRAAELPTVDDALRLALGL